MNENLKAFFSTLGYSYDSDFDEKNRLSSILGKTNFYLYHIANISDLYFIYLSEFDFNNALFEAHNLIWNDNHTEIFVIISDYKTYICSAKYKPDNLYPLNCKLASFEYGVNSPQIDSEALCEIKKDSIDYGFFWDFVRKHLKENERQSVDDDLLINLLHLKADLNCVPPDKTYILIERCLFLKFLEDRRFLKPATLLKILKEPDSKPLINKFKEINRALNGDIFVEEIFSVNDIPREALQRLYYFFTSDYKKQIQVFPYDFNVLPVELLSSIYEAFLKADERIGGGVYYTPSSLVDIVLNDTLEPALREKQCPSCIDFSCGSGVFLVKAYERLIEKHDCYSEFQKKKDLLKNCIFGIEKDEVAARITIFSLYLKLIEGETSDFMIQAINDGIIKFPKLFNKNIQRKNTLFDKITLQNEDGVSFEKFDVVVGNPPWGINPFQEQTLDENSKMNLAEDMVQAVAPFQSSQYFIFKAQDFMSNHSIAGILSNNSNLVTTKSNQFRMKFLQKYDLEKVYDFTQCNPFRKRSLKINTFKKEEFNLGADEPPAILIFRKKRLPNDQRMLKYITPSTTSLTKLLRVISIKSTDEKSVLQELLEDDLTWRVLTAGDMQDRTILKKLDSQSRKNMLKGHYGLRFKVKGDPIWRNVDYFDKDCIDHYSLLDPKRIDENGKSIRRPGAVIKGKILVKRYVGADLRIKAAYDSSDLRYKDNLIGLVGQNMDYRIVLALCNSSLAGYFLFHNSAQIGKGTFNMLMSSDLENLPIPDLDTIPLSIKRRIFEIITIPQRSNNITKTSLDELDELFFDIFNLKIHEKQRIRDFFNIADRRKNGSVIVKEEDFHRYGSMFRNVFYFILKDDKFLNAEAFFSCTLGAGITFRIVEARSAIRDVNVRSDSNLAKIISKIMKDNLESSRKNKIIKEEKLKIYTEKSFTILKSNSYQDWTESEAIKDAREEIELFVRNLPNE
ncbi:hypothetical protein C4565_07025 [Candidatus Parcubacteria bacterium]|nr:MAG: hypothetical protein C4565_07025 [Candidatus Parcubacteria bacterium]